MPVPDIERDALHAELLALAEARLALVLELRFEIDMAGAHIERAEGRAALSARTAGGSPLATKSVVGD